MILRPDAVVLPTGIEKGLEVCFSGGVIDAIRPWTSESRNESGFVLSPKFVNAHSHLEYFDLLGAISISDYWSWITELTNRKHERDPATVTQTILEAARLNLRTGVWAIAEWSDWEGSDAAMSEVGLDGVIFQEVITIREWASPSNKLDAVKAKVAGNSTPTYVTPHAPFTVSPAVIAELATAGEALSIHVAETDEENSFYLRGAGPIAELYAAAGIEFQTPGKTAIEYLDDLGALHSKTQLVHLCAATDEDIDLVAERGCSVAHCPRSNVALGCPVPQIGEMIDRGIRVGLGLDSAASSGEIDMFAEMRAALRLSTSAKRTVTSGQAWTMATRTDTAPGLDDNSVTKGTAPRLMLIESAPDFDSLISRSPEQVHEIHSK